MTTIRTSTYFPKEALICAQASYLLAINRRVASLRARGLRCEGVSSAQIGSVLFVRHHVDIKLLSMLSNFLRAVELLDELPSGKIHLIGAAVHFASGRSLFGQEPATQERLQRTLAAFVKPVEADQQPDWLRWFAHNFRNMIGPLVGYAELAEGAFHDQDVAEALRWVREVKSTCSLYSGHVERLIRFLSPQRVGKISLEPVAAVKGALRGLISDDAGIKLIGEYHSGLPVIEADLKLLKEMIREIVANALIEFDSKVTHRMIHVFVERVGSVVRIGIWNSSSSIEAELLTKVFQPFITTRSTDEGLGLGLALVEKYAKLQGWQVKASNVDNGVAITIDIPVKEGE